MSDTPSGNRGDTTKWPYRDSRYKADRVGREKFTREANPRRIDFANSEHDAVVLEKSKLQQKLEDKELFPSDEDRGIRDQLRYKGSLTKEEVKQLKKMEENLYVRLWYMLSDFQNLLDAIQDYDSSEGKRKYYDTLQNLHVIFPKQLAELKAKIARKESKNKTTRSKRRAKKKQERKRTKPGNPGGYGRNGLAPLRF